MADNLTKRQRSYAMSMIRRSHTKPELKIKKLLKGFKHNPKKIFGNPDFIDEKNKIVVFVDGCFWHKCLEHYRAPKSNKNYWIPKINKNTLRDKEITLAYKNSGWKVLRIWEHELKK